MALPPPASAPYKRIVWWIIALSLGAHLVIYFVSTTWLDGWKHEHLPVHTLVEALGSAIALFVAYKLLTLRKHNIGPKHATRIAQALIVMGLLDGFHAMSLVNNNFVWLHSLATFLGGVFFLMLGLPEIKQKPVKKSAVLALFVSLFSLACFLFPESVPKMVEAGQFTPFAKLLNLVGGLFLCTAAILLIFEYYKHRGVDDLLFAMHSLLFGLAALMFQSSVLWDASWWGWHILRLCAYGVALFFVVLAETHLLQQVNEYGDKMSELALTDPLTQVHNRRYFDEKLAQNYSNAIKQKDTLSVVMLDIDHFKHLNDQYGHAQGDKVLINVAKRVQRNLRESDFLARIGGEEFALILPNTNTDEALPLVERIRRDVEAMSLETDDKITIKATASFGIAELASHISSEAELLKLADQALYEAKSAGRNRTHIFQSS